MRITRKGRVTTFPQEELEGEPGLQGNTEVEFTIERGAAVVRPKRGAAHAQHLVSHLKAHGAKMQLSSQRNCNPCCGDRA